METTGAAQVDGLRRDVACPQCEYNLRGLRGNLFLCPECGAACDVAKLMRLRRHMSWQRSPLLPGVYLPAVWVLLAPPALLVVVALELNVAGSLIWLLLGLGVWCLLMAHARRLFEGKNLGKQLLEITEAPIG